MTFVKSFQKPQQSRANVVDYLIRAGFIGVMLSKNLNIHSYNILKVAVTDLS